MRTKPDGRWEHTPGKLVNERAAPGAAGKRLSLLPVPAGPAVRPSPVAEGLFRREVLPWGLLGLALGLVEGATAAILVKQHFAGVAPPFAVNLAVALVSGAPAFSNVLSFVWANLAHGRARVQLMVALQGGVRAAGRLRGVRLAGRRRAGAGTCCRSWRRGCCGRASSRCAPRSGPRTTRATCWRASPGASSSSTRSPWRCPRRWSAGRSRRTRSMRAGCTAAGRSPGSCGAWLYRAMRVRREFRLLAAEAASAARSEPFSLRDAHAASCARIPPYREYMLWMGIFGGGKLMLTAQLVLVFSEQLHLSSATQIGTAGGGAADHAAALPAVVGAAVRRLARGALPLAPGLGHRAGERRHVRRRVRALARAAVDRCGAARRRAGRGQSRLESRAQRLCLHRPRAALHGRARDAHRAYAAGLRRRSGVLVYMGLEGWRHGAASSRCCCRSR